MPSFYLQIITVFFAVFALSRAYLRFKEKKLSSPAFFFWFGLWMVGTIVVIVPDMATRVANLFGIGRGADVVIYSSIAILFYMVFRVYIKIEDTQKQITDLARAIALEKYKKPTLKKSSKR
jgi:small membrane protein